jgi:hypothetical protein
MKCTPKVREGDRAVHENSLTKILATLPTARREESKGIDRRTEKKQSELSLEKPPVFERGSGNTFLKTFGHSMLKISGTSKIHVFHFHMLVQHRDQHAVPEGNQSL